MAAKVNTTKRISLQNGSPDNKPQFSNTGVRGGGTRIAGSGKSGGTTPGTGNGFGTTRGIQKGK